MGMSGNIGANCTKCQCVFRWSTDNQPFADAVFVGTCSNCMSATPHECVNEFMAEENLTIEALPQETNNDGII